MMIKTRAQLVVLAVLVAAASAGCKSKAASETPPADKKAAAQPAAAQPAAAKTPTATPTAGKPLDLAALKKVLADAKVELGQGIMLRASGEKLVLKVKILDVGVPIIQASGGSFRDNSFTNISIGLGNKGSGHYTSAIAARNSKGYLLVTFNRAATTWTRNGAVPIEIDLKRDATQVELSFYGGASIGGKADLVVGKLRVAPKG